MLSCSAEGYIDYVQENIAITADETHTLNIMMDALPNQDDNLQLVTRLKGNHPNPFNPETTISFELKQRTQVSLKIYNLRGQLICSLLDDQIDAGNHSIVWNGTDRHGKTVSSGIYYYRLQVADYKATRSMVLMK
jgi:hypothetical protein